MRAALCAGAQGPAQRSHAGTTHITRAAGRASRRLLLHVPATVFRLERVDADGGLDDPALQPTDARAGARRDDGGGALEVAAALGGGERRAGTGCRFWWSLLSLSHHLISSLLG